MRLLFRAPVPLPFPATAVQGDLFDDAALSELVTGADVVVHSAAFVHRNTRSAREHDLCWKTNVDGTRRLIDAVARSGSDPFLIYVSTVSVYDAQRETLTEETATLPANVYGRSKLQAEQDILEACTAGKLRAAILRPAVVIGPGAPGNVARLIAMARKGFFLSDGSGRVRKSLLPIENLIAAIEAVATLEPPVAVFNVGGDPLTLGEIRETIQRGLGSKARAVPLSPLRLLTSPLLEPARKMLPPLRRVSEQVSTYTRSVVVDDTKLRAETSYHPVISPAESLLQQTLASRS